MPFGMERPYLRYGSGFRTGSTTSRRKSSLRACMPATLSRPSPVADIVAIDDEAENPSAGFGFSLFPHPSAFFRRARVVRRDLASGVATHLSTTRESSSPPNFDQWTRGGRHLTDGSDWIPVTKA